jgi:hypothetical protein
MLSMIHLVQSLLEQNQGTFSSKDSEVQNLPVCTTDRSGKFFKVY